MRRSTVLRALANCAMGIAERMVPQERSAWAQAMRAELEHIDNDFKALAWALGCCVSSLRLFVAERVTKRPRAPPRVPRARDAFDAKIDRALFHAKAALVVPVIVAATLMISVIPQFESLFVGFGADLPAPTRVVIGVSNFVRDFGWLLLIAIVGGSIGFNQAKKRSRRVRYFVDGVMLRLPILGIALQKVSIARYARTLSTTLSAGVPLVEALQSSAAATGNAVYEAAVSRMRDEVAAGQPLQRAMENTQLFPSIVDQMIAVGDQSGLLHQWAKVADLCEEEAGNAVDSISSRSVSLIATSLGVLIVCLVIPMYLPIFNMGKVF